MSFFRFKSIRDPCSLLKLCKILYDLGLPTFPAYLLSLPIPILCTVYTVYTK